MTTKADNPNLNLLLTVIIAVLILFLVFKDKINLGAFYTEQDTTTSDSDTPYANPAAIQNNLQKINTMETQLKLGKAEQIERDILNDKTVTHLEEQLSFLTLELERLGIGEKLAQEQIQQEKLLSEQLVLQLDSERLNAQTITEERSVAETTIEALNAALEQEQKDTQIMRRDKELYGLENHALKTELQLKKKEIVRSKLEIKRIKDELARKNRIIGNKTLEITRKESELSRVKKQFATSSSSPAG